MPNTNQLTQLYETYSPTVFGCAYAMLKNRASAEDITQTVFIKLFNNDDSVNPIRSYKAWLITAARNLACNYIRDQKREVYQEEDFEGTSPDFEDQVVYSVDIGRALKVLNDLEHQLFMLHYMDGYKYRELSEIFSLPIGTVKTHCHCAKKKLVTKLNEMKQEDSYEIESFYKTI